VFCSAKFYSFATTFAIKKSACLLYGNCNKDQWYANIHGMNKLKFWNQYVL